MPHHTPDLVEAQGKSWGAFSLQRIEGGRGDAAWSKEAPCPDVVQGRTDLSDGAMKPRQNLLQDLEIQSNESPSTPRLLP